MTDIHCTHCLGVPECQPLDWDVDDLDGWEHTNGDAVWGSTCPACAEREQIAEEICALVVRLDQAGAAPRTLIRGVRKAAALVSARREL